MGCTHSEPWYDNLIRRHYPVFHWDVAKENRPTRETAMSKPEGQTMASNHAAQHLGNQTPGTDDLEGLPMGQSQNQRACQGLPDAFNGVQPGAGRNIGSMQPPPRPTQNLRQLTCRLALTTPPSSSRSSTAFSLSSSSQPQDSATLRSSVASDTSPRDQWKMSRTHVNGPLSSPLARDSRAGEALRVANQPDESQSESSSQLSDRQRGKMPMYKMRQFEGPDSGARE